MHLNIYMVLKIEFFFRTPIRTPHRCLFDNLHDSHYSGYFRSLYN